MKTVSGHSRVIKIAALALAFAMVQSGLLAQTVDIPNPELEWGLRIALQKPEGDITVADMESLTSLYIFIDLRGSITGLETATNLTELTMNGWTYWDLSDLSPLAGLTKLEYLRIWSSNLTDISPLAGLTNLTELDLGGVGGGFIRDISPLAGLTNLTELKLSGNDISDLSPLAGLTNLTELGLERNNISDLSPLANLTKLTSLWLHGGEFDPRDRGNCNSIHDISPLAGLTNLTRLDLSNNLIEDITPLAGLTNLRDVSPDADWGRGLQLSNNYIDITPGSPSRQVIDSLNAIEGLTVVFEPQNELEPLFGGVRLRTIHPWFYSPWFGAYSTWPKPWLFHAEHGFIYRDPSSTTEGMYIYDDALDTWCWTSEDVYPAVYAFNPGADNQGVNIIAAWLWYFKDTKTPRSFRVLTGPSATQTLFFGP